MELIMSLREFFSTAYNDVLYIVIIEICDVGELKQVHEVSKQLQPLSLKMCDTLADWVCV